MDLELFWRLTPREIARILDGAWKRALRRHDEARARNYELAQLVAVAVNNPSKIPKFEKTETAVKAAAPARTDTTLGDDMLRAFLSGNFKKKRPDTA